MIYKFFNGIFFDFLTEELLFTLKMIKKSFSNFSAWHYRSKLITLDLLKRKLSWSNESILDYFKEDLHYLKNAIFTDPRDQSPWNYQNWILGNIIPIILKHSKFDGFTFNLNFNQKIPFDELVSTSIKKCEDADNNLWVDFDYLSEQNNSSEFDLISFISKESKTENLSLSKFFNDNFTFDLTNLNLNLNLSDSKIYKISLSGKYENSLEALLTDENLKFNNKLIPLKNNLDFPEVEIIFDKNGIKNIKKFYKNKNKNNSENEENKENCYFHIKKFLENQVEMLDELIKVTEEYIENAHFRKLQILMIQNYLGLSNNKDLIISERDLLISKSKRMKEVYKNINFDFIE